MSGLLVLVFSLSFISNFQSFTMLMYCFFTTWKCKNRRTLLNGDTLGITATDNNFWNSVAVINESDLSAVSHNRYRICCVINGSDSVHLKSINRIASVICARRASGEHSFGKPSVDQKTVKIWVPPLFYSHFPSLWYFCIGYITHVDMQRERDYGYRGIYDIRQIKWAITIAYIFLRIIICRPLRLKNKINL